LDVERRVLDSEVESLKQRMRQHGPAAGVINDMIHGYLGHKELEIAASEDGYHFRRNGKPMEGSLSEGEKTAIALCYFLARVAAEGRKLKDLIVAVDDPISSLDTKALNYAFSIIKGALSDAAQLIMMTHNLHFMNEAKKWLKKKTEKEVGKDKATATLLFLDAVQEAGTETRSSSIRIMPALIREYESEYHYLFHMVLEFSRSPYGKTEYFYFMPKALRKVLEIFLAFKLPGSEGLSSKVENVAKAGYGNRRRRECLPADNSINTGPSEIILNKSPRLCHREMDASAQSRWLLGSGEGTRTESRVPAAAIGARTGGERALAEATGTSAAS
jgi:wobble nucleotide-excising tRNase